MIPWCFAYDRINYARYVPVYLKEMHELKDTHPFSYEHLRQGKFEV